jgi:type I restriction enzyme R subunit
VLKVIEARNEQEALVGTLIQEFADNIEALFAYARNSPEGKRLIIKIKSHVSEDEIYDDFAKIYRRYRALNRKTVGDYFFKETEDLVNKLCDDFEITINRA